MDEPYPPRPRVVGAAAGGAVLLLLTVPFAWTLLSLGAPLAAATVAVLAAPLALYLVLLAAAPAALQRVLRRFTRIDLRDGGHVAASVVMGLTLFYVLGAQAAGGVFALEEVLAPSGGVAPPPAEPGAAAPNLTATFVDGGVNLTWTVPGDANATYRIYRGLTPNATFRVAEVENATAWRDGNASGGREHHYRVTRVDGGVEGPPSEPASALVPIEETLLYGGLVENLMVMTLPALLYVSFVHGTGPRGAARALGLRHEGFLKATGLGVLATVAFLVLASIVLGLLSRHVDVSDNERATALGLGLSLGGAFFVAVASGVSEEVLFRGFLQPRIGILAQAVLFAVAHLGYVDAVEVAVVFVLGILFALLYRWTGSLWAPIAAHFAFNLINLVGIICGADPAQCGL